MQRKSDRPTLRRKPPQLRFRTERALVTQFLGNAKSRPTRQPTLVRTEFDATNGVVDILRVALRPGWKKHLLIGKVHPRWAYALRAMPYRRRVSLAQFVELTGFSEKTARMVLGRFARLGYCERSGRLHWIKRKQPQPLVREITAIEAKLGDWRRALAQAYRHLVFAHRSWVLLDTGRASPAIRALDEFRRRNVGLLTLSPNGRPTVRFSPLRRKPKSLRRFWLANAEFARRLLAQVSFGVFI